MSYGDVTIIYYAVLCLLLICNMSFAVIIFFLCEKKRLMKRKESILPTTKVSASSYPLVEIYTATDGFNHRRIIGKGRLGTVYAAVMPRGELAVVKRIHPRLVLNNAGFGFSSTNKWLSLSDHPHVVPIKGFSEAPGERIIVMGFNGMLSLDFYLHQNPDGSALLDWGHRLRIAAGTARGIQYLHEATPPIIHGCVKPSNILMDAKFCARICDYGLNFLAPHERDGLVGYVDEEYWNGEKFVSKESDVFGFGVVMLELLSGRRSEGRLIVEWAIPLIKGMKFSELLDPRLVLPSDFKPLFRLARVALACVGNCRKNRPSMVQVVTIMNNLEMELTF